MPIAIAEAVNLVLDRRAIARPLRTDRAREQRRTVQPAADDVVRARIGARNRAEHLRHRPRRRQRRHRPGFGIAGLFGQPRPVDRATIQPGRRTRFQSRHRQIGGAQLSGQPMRRALADAAALHPFLTPEQTAAKEGARTQDHGGCLKRVAAGQIDADDAATPHPQRRRFARNHGQAGLSGDHALDRGPEQLAIGLDARPLHRAALRAVEHPVMDRRRIGRAGDQPVGGIDLAHQMALAQPPDRRIATHRADRRRIETHQRRPRTHARRNGRRLDAGMTAADHDHIELLHGMSVTGERDGRQSTFDVPRGTSRFICRCRTARTAHRAYPRCLPARQAGPAIAGQGAALPQQARGPAIRPPFRAPPPLRPAGPPAAH